MSDWITDRRPTEEDGPLVYDNEGTPVHYTHILIDQAWKPIPRCEPYVKPRRWTVQYCVFIRCWELYSGEYPIMSLRGLDCNDDEHREAAERIAAIYEEVMP